MKRRQLLRGALAGAGVCLPVPHLEAAQRPVPVRFGVFYWGGGIVHDTWVPASTGRQWTLPDSLQPFAELQPYMTLITGTNHQNSSPGHIPARGIALSSSHDLDTGTVGVGTYRGQLHPEPSVDTIVADAWRGRTLLDSVEIGICRKGPYRSNSSWRAGGRAYNRHEPSPQRLFDRLFGGGGGSVLAATTALDKSVLDVLMAEARVLGQQVSRNDQRRLDQHMDGLRAIEKRLQERERLRKLGPRQLQCAPPNAPSRQDFGDGTGREEKEAKSRIMSDLLAVALACDLTRVFSFEFSAGQSHAVYWEVDAAMEHHPLTHKEAKGGPDLPRITKFIMSNYAYLARRLRDMPEGGGNVLDNTLILGTSEHANAGRHDYADHPFLLLGKAGGRLRGGLHHRETDPKNLMAPRVLLTAVRAVGVPCRRLGQARGGEGNRMVDESLSAMTV